MNSIKRIAHRYRFALAIFAVLLCVLLSTGDFVQGQNINMFDKKKKSAPSAPRPKADESITKTIQEGLQKDFSPGSIRQNVITLLFVFAFGATVVGLVYYDFKRRQRLSASYDSPDALFGELCAVHELTKSEARFLHTLADDLDLADPLPLFIEPKHLQNAFGIEKYHSSVPMLHYFLEKLFDIESEPIDEDRTILVGGHSRSDHHSRYGGSSVYRPHR